jgi:hypothetical protein
VRRVAIFLLLFINLLNANLASLARSTGPSIISNQGFESVSNEFTQDYQRSSQRLDDALDEHVPIGFDFPFNGQTYSEVIISSNGVIYFRSSGEFENNSQRSNAAFYSNKKLSDNTYALDNGLFPYWDDLNPNQGGKIKYGNVGSGDGEHFVVSWEDVPHYNKRGSYSFQVALYKDGTIIFRYDKNSDADGESIDGATIGIKEDSSHYDQYSYNSSISQTTDVVYRVYKNLNSITPSCNEPKEQILMATYKHNSSHPNNSYQFIDLRENNQNGFGSGYVDNINGSGNPYGDDNYYWSKFDGYINIPTSGVYEFGVDGDDAVEVYIDNKLITGWYGGHGKRGSAQYVIKNYFEAGWHKINFYQEENSGGDNYYLYWKRPGGSLEIVPSSYLYHCLPTIKKSSCVVSDPVNNTTNPKRIPGSIIRYAIEVQNNLAITLNNAVVRDEVDSNYFDISTIKNIQISQGSCDCANPKNSTPNGPNGSSDGQNPVKIDFESLAPNAKECGYFEVELK